MVRDGAPPKPATGPPTKGPPVLEDELPSEEEEVETKLPTLAPILKPVRKPISIQPKVAEPTVLKPVGRAVLKPISQASVDEEE